MQYIRIWVFETLQGTTFTELNCEERGVFWSLCVMAGSNNRNPGIVELRDGVGYSLATLAELLNCQLDALKLHLQKLKSRKINKIYVRKNGTIKIVNWKKYQTIYARYYKNKYPFYKDQPVTRVEGLPFKHNGILYYRLVKRFDWFYRVVKKQPFVGINENRMFKLFQQLYNKFNDAALWEKFSLNQFNHVCKIIKLFFRQGIQNQWRLTPENLLSKTDRLQLLLTQNDDGIFKPFNEKDAPVRKLLTCSQAIDIVNRNRTTAHMQEVLSSLAGQQMDEFVEWIKTNAPAPVKERYKRAGGK